MIRWVFLDVGNVLLDEDPLGYVNARVHWEEVCRVRPDLGFRDLLATREQLVASGSRWPLFDAVHPILGDEGCSAVWARAEGLIRPRYAEFSPAILGASEAVSRLSRRFRLGLIANQGGECREVLNRLGMLEAFEVVALSEEVGLAKPDPDLFRFAIELARAEPKECLMVGDRLDNDIIPASVLGMQTVWIRWPTRSAKGWRPDDPDALAWRDSLERSSAMATTLWSCPLTTVMIDSIQDLDRVL
ncbi:HAD family hydrolase [Singulisphaera rosea]